MVLFFQLKSNILLANSEDPDQTPRSAASDLGLHCFPKFHKKDAMHISLINIINFSLDFSDAIIIIVVGAVCDQLTTSLIIC